MGAVWSDAPAVDSGSAYVFDLAPAVSAFSIDAGATVTSDRTVRLNNTCTLAPTQFLASESPTFAGASWQAWSPAPTFVLSKGNGPKTVYFKAKNAQGESAVVVSDTIVLDKPPEAAWSMF